MELDAAGIDKLVFEIVRDCGRLVPPPGREDIFQHFLDHLRDHVAALCAPIASKACGQRIDR